MRRYQTVTTIGRRARAQRPPFAPDVEALVDILVGPAVVDVALVPVYPHGNNPVVEVALVPTRQHALLHKVGAR